MAAASRRQLLASIGNLAELPPGSQPCTDGTLIEAGVQKVLAGRLSIVTNSVAAFDPIIPIDVEPFDTAVPNGRHPVFVWIVDFGREKRCAGAFVEFSPSAGPNRWVAASSRWLSPDKQSRYGVDSGFGCFADNRAADFLYDDDIDGVIAVRQKIAQPGGDTPRFGTVDLPNEHGNVIYFETGWGDGAYIAPSLDSMKAGG